MRKMMLLFFILAVCSSPLVFSETVMLYIENSIVDEELYKVTVSSASALEDGVMNEFFDNGHIIFNAGLSRNYELPDPPYETDRESVRIAKLGGADFLLEVLIDYHFLGDRGVPVMNSAEYTFSYVRSLKLLGRDKVKIDMPEFVENTDLHEQSYRTGQLIAQQALSMW